MSHPLDQLISAIQEDLQAIQQQDLLRTLTTIEEIRGPTVRINGTWLVSWCTNDYLGLASHPRVIAAALEAAKRFGVGSRASRLLAGSTRLHADLEDRLASFFHAESAVVYPSGYLANLGTLSALLGPQDVVLVDRLAHASLIDACRAARATFRVFRHHDVAHVAATLERHANARRRLVVTEGVFSMDGDMAPLNQLLEVAQHHDALLYVDDAHGAFAIGSTGRGSPEVFGVPHEAMIYMGTLGKALGCQGGFVVGPTPLVQLLQNRARTFVYATALATPIVGAAVEALRLIEDDSTFRQRLADHVQRFHQSLSDVGGVHVRPPSHIIPFVIGSARRAREVSAQLWQRGMFAPAIRPPTVPEGTARLRISLSALHTPQQLEALSQLLHEFLPHPVSSHASINSDALP